MRQESQERRAGKELRELEMQGNEAAMTSSICDGVSLSAESSIKHIFTSKPYSGFCFLLSEVAVLPGALVCMAQRS
jgi:hypothetical protein